MRGPGLKLDLDVRRLWTCPACGRQRRLSGNVTTAVCPCRDGGVLMQLTADPEPLQRAERLTPIPVTKRPRPPGWTPPAPEIEEPTLHEAVFVEPPKEAPTPEASAEPIAEAAPESPPAIPAQPPVSEEVMDDFGADIGLPPESAPQSESAG